jgi:GNAT superfamily N-acetyltransferase
MTLEVLRCSTADPRFQALVGELDAELVHRYGPVQALYSPHNKVEAITTAVVAVQDGRALGCGCFKRHGPDTLELKRIYVAPDARRLGVGRRLVETLEAWGRELGFARAVLETGTSQPDAVALYTRCGYRPTPCFGPYVDLPASLCLAKALG